MTTPTSTSRRRIESTRMVTLLILIAACGTEPVPEGPPNCERHDHDEDACLEDLRCWFVTGVELTVDADSCESGPFRTWCVEGTKPRNPDGNAVYQQVTFYRFTDGRLARFSHLYGGLRDWKPCDRMDDEECALCAAAQ